MPFGVRPSAIFVIVQPGASLDLVEGVDHVLALIGCQCPHCTLPFVGMSEPKRSPDGPQLLDRGLSSGAIAITCGASSAARKGAEWGAFLSSGTHEPAFCGEGWATFFESGRSQDSYWPFLRGSRPCGLVISAREASRGARSRCPQAGVRTTLWRAWTPGGYQPATPVIHRACPSGGRYSIASRRSPCAAAILRHELDGARRRGDAFGAAWDSDTPPPSPEATSSICAGDQHDARALARLVRAAPLAAPR